MAQPRRRMNREDILAAEQEAKARMRASSVAQRLRDQIAKRIPQPGEQGGEYQRSGAPEVSVPLQRGPGPSGYTTRIEGDTVHHIYNDGADRSFHVDNADERRLLAEAGGDYGDIQRHQADPSAFRDQITALAQFRRSGAMPDEATRAGLQATAESNPSVMGALRTAMQGQAARANRGPAIAAGNNPAPQGAAPVTGGFQAPPGLVMRSAAQMREDNPAMVQRVKRRMRLRP